MTKILEKLAGKKTYMAALAAILTAVAAHLTGEATTAEAVQMAITAILAATLRSGIAKA